MERKDFNRLPHGCHTVDWHSGGSSLALIGSNANGTRWMICSNWVNGHHISGANLDDIDVIYDIKSAVHKYSHVKESTAPAGINYLKIPDYEAPTIKVIPPVQGRTVWDWLVEDKDSKAVLINFSIVLMVVLSVVGLVLIKMFGE